MSITVSEAAGQYIPIFVNCFALVTTVSIAWHLFSKCCLLSKWCNCNIREPWYFNSLREFNHAVIFKGTWWLRSGIYWTITKISYLGLIIMIIQECMALPVVNKEDLNEKSGFNSKYVHEASHYIFWFLFWSFLICRILRFLLIRWKLHNVKNKNQEWKQALNHENNNPETFIQWGEDNLISIKYQSWITNKCRMIMVIIIVFLLIFGIQVSIRLIYNSWILEEIVVMIICGLFLTFSYQIYAKMSDNLDNDELYLKQEFKLQLIVSFICFFLHLIIFLFIFIILDNCTDIKIGYEWSRLYIFIFMGWALTMCHIETAYIDKKLDAYYTKMNSKLEKEVSMDESYTFMHSIIDIRDQRLSLEERVSWSKSTENGDNEQEPISSVKEDENMMTFIQKQPGFELFMNYLNKEDALEVGLMIVESTFYLNRWIQDKSAFDDVKNNFPFLIAPHFKTQKENWDYIINKYIYDDSSDYMISHMNVEITHQNKQKCLEVIQNLRKDQINIATSLWTTFQKSREYKQYHKMNKDNNTD